MDSQISAAPARRNQRQKSEISGKVQKASYNRSLPHDS
jgi:hypothetical protein